MILYALIGYLSMHIHIACIVHDFGALEVT